MAEKKNKREKEPRSPLIEKIESSKFFAEKIIALIKEKGAGVINRGKELWADIFKGHTSEQEREEISTILKVGKEQTEAVTADAAKKVKEAAEASKQPEQGGRFQEGQPILIDGDEGKFLKYVKYLHDEKRALVEMPNGKQVMVFLDQIKPIEQPAEPEPAEPEPAEPEPAEPEPAEPEPAEPEPAEPEPAEPEPAEPEPEQISEEAKIFQQAKLEARFGKEDAEKLQAEHILENEKYKGAIDEMVETILSSDKQTSQDEAKIIKKMAESFGDYFSETSKEQKESACWEIFNAIKAQIADEASRRDPKNLKGKLAKGALSLAKGALFGAAGFGGTFLLTPVGGILISGGLRFADTIRTDIISKKRLKEYKAKLNASDAGKAELANTITDLMLAKKKTELIAKKIGKKETWKEGRQKEFAQRYKENALEYLNAHQAEEIGELTEEQINRKAESLAVYFAMDDSTEKMQRELETAKNGKKNTAWKSLSKVFGKIDNTPAKKFYSAAGALGVGLGIRTTAKRLGMSSKWTRRIMMAFAGYKLGGALGEMAAGKQSPEAITRKSLTSLKNIKLEDIDLGGKTGKTILDNYSGEIAKARIAISEIPQTAKNTVQIEKWKRELQSREFALLNETIIKKTDEEALLEKTRKHETAESFIRGKEETTAKKEISIAGKKVSAYKIAGRAIGTGLGLLTADVSGTIMNAIMKKVDKWWKGHGAPDVETTGSTKDGKRAKLKIKTKASTPTQEIPEKYKAIEEKNLFAELGEEQTDAQTGSPEEDLEFLESKEKLGSKRPVSASEHEIGKAEMPEISAADFGYKSGDNIWEESENQLEAALGRKPTVEEIDAMKDSIVEDMGFKEGPGSEYRKMSEDDLKEIDWEKYTREATGSRPQGLAKPEIEHPDIDTPEPTPLPAKGPPSLVEETEISQGDELPRYTPEEIQAKGVPRQPRAIEEGLPQSESKVAPEVVETPKPTDAEPVLPETPAASQKRESSIKIFDEKTPAEPSVSYTAIENQNNNTETITFKNSKGDIIINQRTGKERIFERKLNSPNEIFQEKNGSIFIIKNQNGTLSRMSELKHNEPSNSWHVLKNPHTENIYNYKTHELIESIGTTKQGEKVYKLPDLEGHYKKGKTAWGIDSFKKVYSTEFAPEAPSKTTSSISILNGETQTEQPKPVPESPVTTQEKSYYTAQSILADKNVDMNSWQPGEHEQGGRTYFKSPEGKIYYKRDNTGAFLGLDKKSTPGVYRIGEGDLYPRKTIYSEYSMNSKEEMFRGETKLPKYTDGEGNIIYKASPTTFHKYRPDLPQNKIQTIDAKDILEPTPFVDAPAEIPAGAEAPELTEEPVESSQVQVDVEKAIRDSIKTDKGTANLVALINEEPQIDTKLKEAGIDFEELKKTSSAKLLKDKLKDLTTEQQGLYNKKLFITITKKIIREGKIKI